MNIEIISTYFVIIDLCFIYSNPLKSIIDQSRKNYTGKQLPTTY